MKTGSVNLKTHRKTIESTFSGITSLMPKKIYAIRSHGFKIKIINFVIGSAIIFCFG